MAELGETMSSAEFSIWVALYKQAPWDDTRADVQSAMVAATVASYAGKMRKEGSTVELSEFMPFLAREEMPEPDPMEHFGKFL